MKKKSLTLTFCHRRKGKKKKEKEKEIFGGGRQWALFPKKKAPFHLGLARAEREEGDVAGGPARRGEKKRLLVPRA